jgi:hypothetical protein
MVGTAKISLELPPNKHANELLLDAAKQVLDADARHVVVECSNELTSKVITELCSVFRLARRPSPLGYANIAVSLTARQRLSNRKAHLLRLLWRCGHTSRPMDAIQYNRRLEAEAMILRHQ